jgi:hypothetical protein
VGQYLCVRRPQFLAHTVYTKDVTFEVVNWLLYLCQLATLLAANFIKYLIKAELSIKPDAQETAWLLLINQVVVRYT